MEVHEEFDARDAALWAHAGQVRPDSAFFYWPNDLLATVGPTEDYRLVEARVPTELPESDLFAGIPADKDTTA